MHHSTRFSKIQLIGNKSDQQFLLESLTSSHIDFRKHVQLGMFWNGINYSEIHAGKFDQNNESDLYILMMNDVRASNKIWHKHVVDRGIDNRTLGIILECDDYMYMNELLYDESNLLGYGYDSLNLRSIDSDLDRIEERVKSILVSMPEI